MAALPYISLGGVATHDDGLDGDDGWLDYWIEIYIQTYGDLAVDCILRCWLLMYIKPSASLFNVECALRSSNKSSLINNNAVN